MKKWKGDLIFLILVASLVGGWLYLYPNPGPSPLSPLSPPQDLLAQDLPAYASVEGLKLTYRLYEPTEKVEHVLILMHDTLLHSGWYEKLGRDLAQEEVAVYLPDRRGWGLSEGDRLEVSKDKNVLIQDITALIGVARSRYPQTKIFIGGHGRGAGLVMRYVAARRPVDGAILISPYISVDQPNIRAEGWQELMSAHPGEAFLARSGLIYWRVWDYNWPEEMIRADPLIETEISIAFMEETVPDDVDAAYAALTVPLLCIQGRDDPLFDPDETAELMIRFATSDRQLETLPDVDFLSVIEHSANPIANWLDGR